MKKKINSFTVKNWIRNAKEITAQFIIPFAIFQAVRTILMPTTFDVLFLTLLIFVAIAYQLEWI